jgi:uncharacterized membrane protein YhaH (DUF805 family)
MGLFGLFFSISGRIPRSKYWLAHIGILFGAIVCAVMLAPGILAQTKAAKEAGLSANEAALALPSLGVVIMVLVLSYMSFCVSAKRLHDRDKSAWWMLGFQAPATLLLLGQGVLPKPVVAILGIASFIAWVWSVVELGFLRGTDGNNRFNGSGLSLQEFATRSLRDDHPDFAAAPRNPSAPRIPAGVAKVASAPSAPPARMVAPRGPAKPAGFGRRGLGTA